MLGEPPRGKDRTELREKEPKTKTNNRKKATENNEEEPHFHKTLNNGEMQKKINSISTGF